VEIRNLCERGSFHLFRYRDEQTFRYCHRNEKNDYDRFGLAASQIFGKRLTWNEVTGKQSIHKRTLTNRERRRQGRRKRTSLKRQDASVRKQD